MASLTTDTHRYYYIASANTYQVKTKKGVLRKIIVNAPVSTSTIKLIDNTSGSTVNIGTITNSTDVKPYAIEYNISFDAGLRIITSGADLVTVVYD